MRTILRNGFLEMRSAVEARGTYLLLGKADSVNQILKSIELQGGETIDLPHLLYHLTVAATSGLCILVKMCIGIAFNVLYDPSGEEFHL